MITKNLKKLIYTLVFTNIFFVSKNVFAEAIPNSISNYIKTTNISKSYIVGDENTFSNTLIDSFPNSYKLGNGLGKSDPYDRNYQLNQNYGSNFINKSKDDAQELSINYNTIYVACGDDFPDALSGSALASKSDSPIFIVSKDESHGYMSQLIRSMNFHYTTDSWGYEMDRQKVPKKIVILGGNASISSNYENMLKNNCVFKPTIVRVSGQNRYGTSVNISKMGWNSSNYVILVNGNNYPDALSSSILAKKYNAPILLTGKDSLDTFTLNEIKRLGAKNVLVIGGTGAVSPSIENKLHSMGVTTERIAGRDRYETSIKIAQRYGSEINGIFVVNGHSFQDGISIAPLAASNSMPLILAPSNISVKKPVTPTVPTKPTTPVKPTSPTTSGYDKSKTGNIQGVITWQYNNFIGTKGDVGAHIALIPKNLNKNSDNKVFVLTASQVPNGENGIYSGKADGYGNYQINDVPAGEYYLLIVSNNTTGNLTIDPIDSSVLQNLFSQQDWQHMQATLKLNKYELKPIQITPNKTIIQSHDFGNTYF